MLAQYATFEPQRSSYRTCHWDLLLWKWSLVSQLEAGLHAPMPKHFHHTLSSVISYQHLSVADPIHIGYALPTFLSVELTVVYGFSQFYWVSSGCSMLVSDPQEYHTSFNPEVLRGNWLSVLLPVYSTTFNRLLLLIYFQPDATLHILFISGKLLDIFRVVSPPIIRSTHNCIYGIWYLSNRYCYLPLLWKSWNWFECGVGIVLICFGAVATANAPKQMWRTTGQNMPP